MLTLMEQVIRHCDGVSRRQMLTAGSVGLGGLTLPDLLRAEDAAELGTSNKAIINVHLDGGPPQLETIDPKPQAPVEIRGEFLPIATRLPGIQFSELFPRLAASADRFSFVRSLVGSAGQHDAFQCQSGFSHKELKSLGGRPALGCVAGKLTTSSDDQAPAFVDLMQGRPLVRNSGRPGFLGPAYGPFRPDVSRLFARKLEDKMEGELSRLGDHHTTSLTLNSSLSVGRIQSRRDVLSKLDRMKRQVDSSGMMDAMDGFTEQAVGILTSGRFATALDYEQESAAVLDRYAVPPGVVKASGTSDEPTGSLKFLLARRLIEAGVRVVSLSISDFDTHKHNARRMKQLGPVVDCGLTALIQDLDERGMLDDVTVVAWGEFGRSPRINKDGGRDHWPRVSPAIIAGGGCKVGQVLGATDRLGGTAIERPIQFKDVFATLYHNLGFDALNTTVNDIHGRPQYLLDDGNVIGELV